MATGRVPLLDENGRFPDRFAPESVAVDAAAAGVAASEAVTAASGAAQAAVDAVAAKEAAEAVPAQVDTAMAEQVGAGGAFDTKLSATIGGLVEPAVGVLTTPQTPRLSSLASLGGARPPRILSLLTGSNDEVLSPFNCTVTYDAANRRYERGIKLTNNGAGSQVFRIGLNAPSPDGGPLLNVRPWQGMVLELFVADATKISNLMVSIYGSADLAAGKRWQWAANTAPTTTLVTGRNFIRIPASFSSTLPTGEIHRVEVQAGMPLDVANDTSVSITVMGLWLEQPEQASIIMTWDRGYKTAWDTIYADMLARHWPMTLAVDCTRYGDNAGTAGEAITLAQAKKLASENGNSVSFHGWDGAPTSAMTVDQLRADTVKSIKHLQQEFPDSMGRFWRAAYVQNSAAEWAAMKPYLLAAAGTGGSEALGPTMWPPRDMHRIPRWSLDNYKVDSNITDLFARLQSSHMTANVFVHGYHETEPGWDVNAHRWELFRDLADQGVAEGWLRFVTFEQLFLEMGGTFKTSGGAAVAEYTDAQGNRITKTLI